MNRLIFFSVLFYAAFHTGDCITGGQEAKAHSRPYMASVQWNGKHECGGFLISSQWVMSAAHCFQDGRTSGVKVVLGAHSLSGAEDTKQTFDAEVYNHPDFSISNYDNDIALIKLDKPVTQSDAVKPVKFQRDETADPKEAAVVETAGWGSLNNMGGRPDKLHELSIPVMERWRCGRADFYGEKFTSNMLCAADKRKDTCDGDSGGPLLYRGIVVGITSNGGKKCGSSRKPGLYTIISHYASWIDTTTTK
ncbi:complement factor D precursor [Danio rerio]|uniref:Complement factor D (adipsin) n=3 Tax=Bilateria TaxID=33213 RepID=Q6DBS8_DANRE|nr:complement factor D precursor [Danio rerio]AAH78380.2 Zgc:109940 [Danio rerio]AAH95067.1 Zgc:109940 [Danio rerio]AAI65441.1 Zgc:109940 protein [Danio rerio]|eukprot:NP_001018368.1 complement factor D precursor [Danio rerio]